jgi:L-alanine-DL-glutamate epimerase-like enolase superfamily enzyme
VRITAIEAIPYAVPYSRPPRFASGAVETADNVLVRIHTDEGIVGHAEAQPRPYTYGETQASIIAVIRDWLAPALTGVDPLATELVHARCRQVRGNEVARGSLDLAVWDIVGKAVEQPCRVLLGGYAHDAAAAYMVSFGEPAEMAEAAVAAYEQYGIRTFKVKVGREVALDLAACAAVRNALPDAELYVDANRGWTYGDAVRAGEGLTELGVLAVEEPIAIDDRAGRLRLAKRWSVPIIGDESCISLFHAARALEEGAVRTVSIKTARTGFTESRWILGLCLGTATPVVLGSQYEGSAGALATASFAAAFAETADRPAEVSNVIDLADDIVAEPIEIRDGRVAPPDTPGLGIEIDEAKLAHYRVDDRRVLASA